MIVGAHRKPEVVVMSVEQYEALVRSAEQRQAVAEALASVRAEGLEPSWDALEGLEKLARGETDEDGLIETLRRRYQQLLREEIAQTVASTDEIDEELRNLFTAVAVSGKKT